MAGGDGRYRGNPPGAMYGSFSTCRHSFVIELSPKDAIVVGRFENGAEDAILFSSVIGSDWLFGCDETQLIVRWKTPMTDMWAHMRFQLAEDFWLFVAQFAEARTCALRHDVNTANQLNAVVKSFRMLYVMATARNAVNPFDCRPATGPVRLGDDALEPSADEG
ncbi:hypothetical protein C8Q73DRAFT_669615 [Cubamyces lactineus]|nr:hypothetical protein C8Q73DRAFT_669615 [Cubamyces lactineus]